jgi:hypothetical protein
MKKTLAGLLSVSLVFPQLGAAAGFEGKKGEAIVPVLPIVAPVVNLPGAQLNGPTAFSMEHLAAVAKANPDPAWASKAALTNAAVAPKAGAAKADAAKATVTAQAQIQGAAQKASDPKAAGASADQTAGQGKLVFDGAAANLTGTAGPAQAVSATDSSPAERAESRLAKRVEGEASKNAALFAEVLKQKAKGGAPVSKVYAFFEPTGRLLRVSQSPRGNGPSLEVSVAQDGALSLTGSAEGQLSQHNRMSKAQFKSRRHDGFGMARFALARTQTALQESLGTAKPLVPEIQENQAQPEPAASAAAVAAKPKTGPVTLLHELGGAALAAAATVVTFNAFAATAGMLAVVPALIVAYGTIKLVQQALESKRKSHEIESAAVALRSAAAPEAEEEVIELTEKDKIHQVEDSDILEITDQKEEPAAVVEEKKEEPAAVVEEKKDEQPAAVVEEKAPEPTEEELKAQREALVERRRAELETAKQDLASAKQPVPTRRVHELVGLLAAVAVAGIGFWAFGGWGILGGILIGALIADSGLKLHRAAFARANTALQARASAVEAAAASLKSAEDALAAPIEKKQEEPKVEEAQQQAPQQEKTQPMPAVEAEKTVPPGTQLELPFPAEEQPAKAQPQDVVAAGSAARPPTPRSWGKLPAEARQWAPARLVSEKKKAQKRARALADDAQLVGVAINLDDPSAHWTYTFHSKSKGLSFTVYSKKIVSKKLSKKARTVPLWESRIGALEGLEAAYARLKAERQWFKPVRVELVPARGGDASWKFIDAKGREVFVGGTPAAKSPVSFISASGTEGQAGSFAGLPKDAQLGAEALLAEKAAAQKRVRGKSADAKLVGVSIKLDDERAHWNFEFESRSDNKTYTAYPKRTDEAKGVKPLPPIWDSRLSEASFEKAYTALKRAQPGFKPVSAKLAGVWNGAPVWVFTDAHGKTLKAGS